MGRAADRLAETVGSLTSDETLEVEGRALGRKVRRKTFRVLARPEGGWILETGDAARYRLSTGQGRGLQERQGAGQGLGAELMARLQGGRHRSDGAHIRVV